MSPYKTIDIETLDGGKVVVLYLNRPQALNAVNPQLAKDFVTLLKDLASNDSVRAVIISGRGKAFSAGGDLTAFQASQDSKQFIHDLAAEVHAGVLLIRKMNAPVIAAINGACSGVGLSLACCCDFRIASTNARFCFAFTGIGLSADSALPFYLPKIVGLGKATEMALLNPVLTAQEALEIKLVSKVTEPDSLLNTATSLASRLANMPTVAIGKIKKLYDDCYTDGLETHLEKELKYVTETAASPDFKEGCDAFLQKKTPQFKGR